MKKITLILLAVTLIFTACKDESDNEKTQNYLLTEMSSDASGIDFVNLVTEDPDHSIINYIYYYNGGGVAAGDINNDGLPDLYFTANTGSNKLYLNKGNLKFEDISESANIKGNSSWNTGVSMVDINNDGFLDIYVCAVSGLLDFEGHNELFINNGDGTFTEQSKEYGLDFKGYSTQAYFFDFDKDNDLDVYIVNHAVHTTLSHGKADLRNQRVESVGDVLLKNNNGKFTDISEEAGIYGGVNGYGLSASLADFNNDGWDDIYVCNDFHEDDYYYINNQDGTFSERLDKSFTAISRFSMGSDVADINGDGYQDLITLDMLPSEEKALKETEGDDVMFNKQTHLRKLGYKDQYSRNMLQINNGGTYFQETALLNKIADTDWSWAPLFADFDNDSHQDLFISNGILRRPNGLDFTKYVSSAFKGRSESEGLKWLFNSINEMPSGKVANEIFKGNSKLFINKTGKWIENEPNLSNGSVYVDLDLDGDLDLVLNNFNSKASIYKNTTDASNNFIVLDFEYLGANKTGIGTKAKVFSEGKSQLKQLFTTRGFLSATDSKLHFGLNTASIIDSIQIIWPNNQYQIVNSPKVNQNLNIIYTPSNMRFDYSEAENNNSIFRKENLINYKHIEDHYNDFVEEKLIPYKISTLGPAMAIGDVDGNGYEDIFIGSSSGNTSKLYLNNGIDFSELKNSQFDIDKAYEDNAAEFFDADGDGDLDLYVASGVNTSKQLIYQEDRLYINSNGVFNKATNTIPKNPLVATTVKANDYDNDGDMDLFIGNLANANDFGPYVDSYLLNNDGQGNFIKDEKFNLKSKVTAAKWSDINDDGVEDLLVSTEWDTPQLYINMDGALKLQSLPENLNGLWQSIYTYDIDNDGDDDILLGNWGLNTKFNLKFDAPLLMYHSDFDKNGKNETVIAYNKNGTYFPMHSKSELSSQMNIINKIYVDNESYAGKSVEEVLRRGTINDATKYEVHTLASGYLENDNGTFENFIELPQAFQLAPINTFKEIKIKKDNGSQLIAAGNSYKLNTYHGSYSALKGLLVEDKNNFESVSNFGIDPFDQQIKQINTIKMKNQSVLLVLANNDELKTYTFKN